MTTTEWLNKQITDPVATKDYYHLYDDYKETFDSDLEMESFKRKVREAFSEYYGGSTSTSERVTNKDGSIDVRLKTFDFQTEDDLMEASKLDPEIWEISNFKCRATQNENNPYLVIQASFEKKIKDLKYPLIEQVKVDLPPVKEITKNLTNAVLNFSDLHAPFHDERCMNIAISVASDVQPKYIVLNGDLLDCTDLSKYLASIETRNRIQESLNVVAKFIGQLRSVCPNSEIIYIEGNHEDRLRKVILENVSGAVGLKRVNDLNGYDALSIPSLLCLDDMYVKWLPYTENGFWVTDNLKFAHGEELNAVKICKESDYNIVMGHSHRMELVSNSKKTREGQKENWTFMAGCNCKIDGSVPSVKTHMNWQQGFGVIYYNGVQAVPVPVYVHEGVGLFNGVSYVG